MVTIRVKILLGYLATVTVLSAAGVFGLWQLEQRLEAEIGKQIDGLAASLLGQIEDRVYSRAEQVRELVSTTREMTTALETSNRRFLALGNAEERAAHIVRLDALWQAETAPDAAAPAVAMPAIIRTVDNEPLSALLRDEISFFHRETGYPVFGEVFVTNRFGVNVAETSITSDYRQDDEAWWQEGSRQALWLSPVGFDDSSGIFSIDFAAQVLDSDGALLGVLKAVLNIEEVYRILRDFEQASPVASARVEVHDARGALLYPHFQAPQDTLVPGRAGPGKKRRLEAGTRMLRAVVHSVSRSRYPKLGWTLTLGYERAEVLAPVRALRLRFLVIGLAALTVSMLVGFAVAASIAQPIRKASAAAARLANGDLSLRITPAGSGEARQLLEAMRAMLEQLHHTIGGLLSTSRQVKKSADVLGVSSRRIVTGAEDQSAATAASTGLVREMAQSSEAVARSADQMMQGLRVTRRSVDQMVASMESIATRTGEVAGEVRSSLSTADEIVRSVERVAKRAQEVGRASEGAVDEARRGGNVVDASSRGMNELSETIEELVAVHQKLDRSSRSIHRITEVIERIAGQSNLLAINAAIQASQAGMQGEGFAVVAREMQALSESTAGSAKEISQLVEAVEKDIESAAAITDLGARQTHEGRAHASNAARALERIVETSQAASEAMQSIGRDTATQTRVAENMAATFERIGEMVVAVKDETGRHASTSESIRQAMMGLAAASERVRTAIEEHRRDGGEVGKAMDRIAGTARDHVETSTLLVEVTRALEEQSATLFELASFFRHPDDAD